MDWNEIDVLSGEWWLVLIGLLLLAAGVGLGYWWGDRNARRDLYRRPDDFGPPTNLIP